MPEPPNYYQGEMAEHDEFCRLCVHFRGDEFCLKYQVPVKRRSTCDDWERNWEASEHP
jgi:hypothetical protein